MSARRKCTPEQLYARACERELLGLTDDGRLVLWSTGRVIPVDQFQYHRSADGRRWIDAGHFVIDWLGEEVCAHLGNLIDGQVSVLLMSNGGGARAFTRRQVRPWLRYKVIPDPVAEAGILAQLRELKALFVARDDTPDRQRGEHVRRHLFRREPAAAAHRSAMQP